MPMKLKKMKKNKNVKRKVMNEELLNFSCGKLAGLKKIGVSKVKIISNISLIFQFLKIKNSEFSLNICGDAYIKKLNSRYRKLDKPTDVLSFRMSEINEETGRNMLGDIVISVDTVMKQSKKYDEKPATEFYRMLIHGIQHLTGVTHETERKYKKMMNENEKILKILDYN